MTQHIVEIHFLDGGTRKTQTSYGYLLTNDGGYTLHTGGLPANLNRLKAENPGAIHERHIVVGVVNGKLENDADLLSLKQLDEGAYNALVAHYGVRT